MNFCSMISTRKFNTDNNFFNWTGRNIYGKEKRNANKWKTSKIWTVSSWVERRKRRNLGRHCKLTLSYLFIFLNFIYLFIYFWLCWVFVSVRGLSLVAASGGRSSSRCADLSLLPPLLLRSTGSRRAGSVVVAHGPSCSAACGIFPDQGSNPCPLHWQADSQPLRHQGSPDNELFF